METTQTKITPQDVTVERYARIGWMTAKQRVMYCFIMERSSRGLWTNYEDCRDAGILGERKLISTLCDDDRAGINKRRTEKGTEFCL